MFTVSGLITLKRLEKLCSCSRVHAYASCYSDIAQVPVPVQVLATPRSAPYDDVFAYFSACDCEYLLPVLYIENHTNEMLLLSDLCRS